MMNTTAHVAASLLIWKKEPGVLAAGAITAGALLPDLPMFGFYVYQKLIGSSEALIWGELYFQPHWQLLFDLFNSFPLTLLVLAACYWKKFRIGMLFSLSMLFHLALDLPLHHDDAHRHFLPFSDWRFVSPVSYWDPNRLGAIFIWFELVFGVGACLYVAIRGGPLPMRIVAVVTLLFYALFIAFALAMWT